MHQRTRLSKKRLGRSVQTMKGPAVKGKLTGIARHIPTINISAVDPTVKIKIDHLEEISAKAKRRSET